MNKVGTKNEAARTEWLRKTLADISPGARILDAGAGEQQFRPFCSHLDYVAQDFAQYDGKGDAKGLQVGKWDQTSLDIVSDITAIPEPEASFDAILCAEVLEHLPDPVLALREFSRLLKRGGELILTAPFCSLTHFAPYHFSTGFSRYFYRTQLPACGFEITELVENGNYFEYLAQEVRRIPTVSDMYVGSRPKLFEYLAVRVVLNLLERLSSRDRGSSDLLHYGCFVKATRK